MAEPIDLSKLDKRTVERHLRSGAIDEKTYERYLKSLDDASEKAAQVETTMLETESDEDEDSEENA